MKRASRMNTHAARQFSTLCLSGALTLGAFGGAHAAGNDAALQALFAQANYWHEKSHDELAMESLQKVLSVDANNAQALYLMALWAQQGGNLQAAAQWRARLEKAAPDSPGLQRKKNGAGAAGTAHSGQTAGAQRQCSRRAGDLAEYV